MVKFSMKQSGEEIFVTFNDNRESVDYLIQEGYLDEEFQDTYYYSHIDEYEEDDDYPAEREIINAVCDWIEDRASDRDDEDCHEDPFHENDNDVIRAEYIMDENRWFNQYLSYYH